MRLVLWRSSTRFENSAETFETPVSAKFSTFIRLAPSDGVAAARAMNALGVRETVQQKQIDGQALGKTIISPKPARPGFVTQSTFTHGGPHRGG